MRLNKELCEFAGAIIGDGNLWTDGSRYRIDLTGNSLFDRHYFIYLSEIEQGLFNKAPYAPKIKGGTLRMRLQSKIAFNTLKSLGIHVGYGKALKAKIPSIIIKGGWTNTRWVLRGLVDTDGTVFFSKKTYNSKVYPTIEISTSSRILAHQITRLLNERGFRAKLRKFKRYENTEFHVALYGNKMLKKWIKEIGFSNERHINKLVPHYSMKLYTPQ